MKADEERVARVMAALAALAARDPTPWSQGLSPEGARLALQAAIGAITPEGLRAELATPGPRPAAVAVIVAWGVYTSALEWVALLAAAGIEALVKPPSADPGFCEALVAALGAAGLPARLLRGHDLPPEAEVILAFGSDSTMEALRRAWPARRLITHGHRFSLAFVAGDPEFAARGLALDHALYDTRGCMAPTAAFTTGDPRELADALAAAMAEAEARWPRGDTSGLGARRRERVGLARVLGRAIEGERWSVLELPPRCFVPEALPRLATIHPIATAAALAELLAPWRPHLSTLGTDLDAQTREDPGTSALLSGFSRVCVLGTMQAPPFPRRHDGRPMLASILGSG